MKRSKLIRFEGIVIGVGIMIGWNSVMGMILFPRLALFYMLIALCMIISSVFLWYYFDKLFMKGK